MSLLSYSQGHDLSMSIAARSMQISRLDHDTEIKSLFHLRIHDVTNCLILREHIIFKIKYLNSEENLKLHCYLQLNLIYILQICLIEIDSKCLLDLWFLMKNSFSLSLNVFSFI